MAWRVAGTRVRRYRVESPDDITAWVTDEITSIAEGWIPIANDRQADGSLRVTYGDISRDRQGMASVVPSDTPVSPTQWNGDEGVRVWLSLLGALAIVIAFAVMAKP